MSNNQIYGEDFAKLAFPEYMNFLLDLIGI